MLPPFSFHDLTSWRARRRALRDLGRLQEQDSLILARDDSNPIYRAKVAVQVGDLAAAEQFWESACARYPDFALRSPDSLEVLLGLKRFEEAEALMLRGQRRDPSQWRYYAGYASVAQRRGDFREAVLRWARVRRRFPAFWQGYVHGAASCREAGDLHSSERLISTAIKQFPESVEAWWEAAAVAEARSDWAAALERWECIRVRFKHGYGAVGVAKALEQLGRIEEAEETLRLIQPVFPLMPEIPMQRAHLAYRSGDKLAALGYWTFVRQRFPELGSGYLEGIHLLREMGRQSEAEPIASAAIERFPNESWPWAEYALLAHERRDWKAAADRWAVLRDRWPEREDGHQLGAQALAALEQTAAPKATN